MLIGQYIFLRELHASDFDVMLKWENDPKNWKVSGTHKKYTKEEIEAFLSIKQDLVTQEQYRYVICLNDTKKSIGTLDLFEFDIQNNEVGIGILIAEKEYRNKGYAEEVINLITAYCRNELKLVNLFCNIQKDNTISIRLFEKCEFQFVEERILDEEPVNYYELKL